MGILKEPADFIRALKLPHGFSVIELGDQYITHEAPHYIADRFYQSIGAGSYRSIDGNGRATIKADLNLPLADPPEPADLVTDFGTGEHIFDQAQVWRTVHALTKTGGFIAFDRPCQGYERHGFYLTDEWLFRDIAAANRYAVVRLDRAKSKRGELVRGVFHKRHDAPFRVPQQGRYEKALKI